MVPDERGTPQGASVSTLLANVYLHYVFDLWANQWRHHQARGDMIIVRYADDLVVGFEHQDDAERFQAEFGKACGVRPGAESRKDAADRVRAVRRPATSGGGLGKPETFAFLGFTHICAKTKTGRFKLKRITDSKRMRAKLREVKTEMRHRRHLPIPEQGRWLASVLRGHCNYYAVPGNSKALNAFQYQVARHWLKSLRRRSQRHRLTWARMMSLARAMATTSPHPASLARRSL